jgi:hypothetical protein
MIDDADVLEILPVTNWRGPFEPSLQARAVAALEGGRILVLPELGFATDVEEARLLTPGAAAPGSKNISLDPATDRCQGTSLQADEAATLAGMMDRFARDSQTLLSELLLGYGPALERARTSFRPMEVEQRPQSLRQDDRRLHVDAFPTRPVRGRRILRVFTNIAPDGAVRHWEVGEPFGRFAAQFLPRLHAPIPGSSWLLERLGLTRGRRSRYDYMMLGLHDAAKRDETYQREAPRARLAFAPGTTWIVYTDAVLHAALAGRFALEQTFHLPVENMAKPELAPIRILERLADRRLA